MAIRKQEFYEGAALHQLARTGTIRCIEYRSPFFLINNQVLVLLKYSAKARSPWGFTFMPDEQSLLQRAALSSAVRIGLVCGSDGVAAVTYSDFLAVAEPRSSSVHIACYRSHRERYEVNGPLGTLVRKVAPSDWLKILRPEAL